MAYPPFFMCLSLSSLLELWCLPFLLLLFRLFHSFVLCTFFDVIFFSLYFLIVFFIRLFLFLALFSLPVISAFVVIFLLHIYSFSFCWFISLLLLILSHIRCLLIPEFSLSLFSFLHFSFSFLLLEAYPTL